MDKKEYLTNEYLRKKFKSQFELVKYAIRYASSIIRAGRDSHTHSDENPALVVLEAMENGEIQSEFSTEDTVVKEKINGITKENAPEVKVEKIQKKSNNKKKPEFAHKS